MPRFFFTITDGELFPDDEGQDLPDTQAALATATEAAREMIAEQARTGRLRLREIIVISDDRGAVLATLPFRDAVEIES